MYCVRSKVLFFMFQLTGFEEDNDTAGFFPLHFHLIK